MCLRSNWWFLFRFLFHSGRRLNCVVRRMRHGKILVSSQKYCQNRRWAKKKNESRTTQMKRDTREKQRRKKMCANVFNHVQLEWETANGNPILLRDISKYHIKQKDSDDNGHCISILNVRITKFMSSHCQIISVFFECFWFSLVFRYLFQTTLNHFVVRMWKATAIA